MKKAEIIKKILNNLPQTLRTKELKKELESYPEEDLITLGLFPSPNLVGVFTGFGIQHMLPKELKLGAKQ